MRFGFLRAEFIVYHFIIVPLVAFLPAYFAYGVAIRRGDFRCWLDKSSREEITYVLERVLGGQLSPEERTRVVRDFFRLRSCETVDAMRLAGSGRSLARLVKMRGLEHIEAALAAGKGAILCSAHFGSVNCSFSLLGSLGFPVTLVARWSYEDDHSFPILRFFDRLERNKPVVHHLDHPNIRRGNFGVAVEAANVLRRDELIVILLDHIVTAADRAQPVEIDFLNGQASMLPGVITIAQITGAPVLISFMRRAADWRHQVLEISPPMPVEGDTVTAFRRCLAVVDAAIRRDPAHWRPWKLSHLVKMGLLPAEGTRFPVQSEEESIRV